MLSTLLTSFLSLVFLPGFFGMPAEAASTHDLAGYAWSGNVGWLSFNNCGDGWTTCTGPAYGVDLASGASPRALSGYAWSENIGWVTFNGTDMVNSSNCGTGANPPCAAAALQPVMNTTNGLVSGWARACSVYQTNCSGAERPNLFRGDWDGWVRLQGVTYGVLANGTKWTGYAWGGGGPSVGAPVPGSENIGWLQFRGYTNESSPKTFGVNAQVDAVGPRTISCGVDKDTASLNEEVIWTASIDRSKFTTVSSVTWNLPSAKYVTPSYTSTSNPTRVTYDSTTINPKPGWVTVVADGRPYVVDCDAVITPGGTPALPAPVYPNVLIIGQIDLTARRDTTSSGTLETQSAITLTSMSRLDRGNMNGLPYTSQFEIDYCDGTPDGNCGASPSVNCSALSGNDMCVLTSPPISDHSVTGQSGEKTVSGTWTPTLPGDYYVRLCVDRPDTYVETDENDNCRNGWDEISIQQKPIQPLGQGTANCRPSPSLTQVDKLVTWSVTGSPITGGTPPLHYSWDFSDGGGVPALSEGVGLTSTQSVYQTPGSKKATLTVTSPANPGLPPLVISCGVVARVQTFTEF